MFVKVLGSQALIGIGIRSVVALARRDHAYFRRISRLAWITDTVRIVFFTALAFLG